MNGFRPEETFRSLPAPSMPPANSDLYFNGALEGVITCGTDVNVILEDSGGNLITPDSVNLSGNDLTIVYDAPPAPAGVALQFPVPDAHTSYRTGDVGWRLQNGWFDYVPPVAPAKYARLNYSLGINYWYNLLTALTVGGTSNTLRFVDVDGGQTFSSTGNKDKVVIDKLTGLMWVRDPRVAGGANKLWDDAIDTALAYSVTVNGVTYDDWFLPSMTEIVGLFPTDIAQSGMFQGLVTLIDPGIPATQLLWTSTTTSQSNTSRAMRLETSTSRIAMSFGTKTTDLYATYMCRKAYNLIS